MSDIETTSLVFFGDSLSDPGNLYDQTDGVLREVARDEIGGTDEGQISNGAVWTEQIGDVFGTETELNYAVAGAEASGEQRLGDFLSEFTPRPFFLVGQDDPSLDWDMNLDAQVDRFLTDTAGQTEASFTAVIMIGGNDFAGIDLEAAVEDVLAEATPIAAAVVDSTLAAVSELLLTEGSAVEQVVVVSMPVFSFYPSTAEIEPEALAQYDAVVHEMNAEIEAQIIALNDSLSTGTDVVVYVDFTQMSDALADDASSFGLVAPSNLTLVDDAGVLSEFDEDQVMFWDSIHPTTATHGVIAGFTAAAVDESLVALSDEGEELVLTGAAEGSVVFAYGGADDLFLGSGDDIAFGGSGGDWLRGQEGDDQLSGGSEGDFVLGGSDDDVVDGGQDNDILFGGVGNDVLIDGTGSDLVFGGLGDDTFIWVEEILISGLGGSTDTLVGRGGEDALYVVLSSESFALYAEDLSGEGQAEALSTLGIDAFGIEDVIVLEERASLEMFSDQSWYADADLWGLV